MWRPEVRARIENYIANESLHTLSNSIQKSIFRKQKLRTHYLIAGGDHRKFVKVIKVLRVNCAPATGIAKGMLMTYNNRRLLVRRRVHHWTR